MRFRRRNGNGNGDGHDQPLQPTPRVIALLPPPPREEYRDEAGMLWRCSSCGAVGTSRESASAHTWQSSRGCSHADITEYVPRRVYQDEFAAGEQARHTELAVSGIWIVVKMPAETEEGSVASTYRSKVLSARTGLAAIQAWYTEQVAALTPDSTERDREEANGRYVAIDFFTGIRSEARVTSDWRANVELAEGSHA